MSKVPFSVKSALSLVLGAAALWALPTLSAQDKKPAAKPAEKKDAGDELNDQVEKALKELEKLSPQPNQGPAPRINPGVPNFQGNFQGNLQGLDAQGLQQRNIIILRALGNLNMGMGGAGGGANPFERQQPQAQTPASNRLGVTLQKPSPVLAQQLRIPENQGQIVANIRANSAADKAGFQKNDIILELNGKEVPADTNLFLQSVRDVKPNEKITATVMRRGQKETIKDIVLPAVAENNAPPQPQRRPAAGGGMILPGIGGIGGLGGMGGLGGIQMQQLQELERQLQQLQGLPGLDPQNLDDIFPQQPAPQRAPAPAPQKKKGPDIF